MFRKMSGLLLFCLFCVSVCGSVRFIVVRVACCTSFGRQSLRFPSQSVSLKSGFVEPRDHLYSISSAILGRISTCLFYSFRFNKI